jgi:type III secretion protein C
MVIAIIVLAGIGHSIALAAEIKWKKMPYSHYAQKEEIKDLLADFFASQGIGLVCSEKVKSKISGKFNADDPQNFFDEITRAYNLAWYYDGAAVYVYSAHEMTSQILNLGYINMKKFQSSLQTLGIIDERFGLDLVEENRIIFVSGPPRYVQLIAELAQKLDEKAMSLRGRDDIINVFPLKHAWADDKTLYFHDKELVIPGVATLLNNVITGQTAPGQVGWKEREEIMETITKLKGKGLSRRRGELSRKLKKESEFVYPQQPPKDAKDRDATDAELEDHPENLPPSYADTDLGVIQADPRQNAVIVRDREEKMPYYERIIGLLDVPVGLVEIRATIMDVDRSNLQDLGIEWQFTSTDKGNELLTKGGMNSTEAFSEKDGLPMPLGPGANIATIIGDARNFFLTRVNALQKKGNAKILSSPSVLTLNNVEAQLEHSKTFYVRVSGTEEVDLFDVTAGVILRVTPHIIEEKNGSRVKLAIQIEDGNFSETDEEVDEIPVVQNSIINTQAVVGERESLLVGGYMRDEKLRGQNQIPCLGDIPIVGWWFKTKSQTDSNAQRLFLITPTIVPYDSTREMAAGPPLPAPPAIKDEPSAAPKNNTTQP